MSVPRRIADDGVAYTYNDFVKWYDMQAREWWERAAAIEHSGSSPIAAYELLALEPQASSAGCIDTRTAPESDCVGDRPRDATEPSRPENALPIYAGDKHEYALALAPALSTDSPSAPGSLLQCSNCDRPLCTTEDLAFFQRVNKQQGVEVHLMLKPENKEPATFIRSPITEKGALASWLCACGFKLGDTRPVAVKKAPMTAFKSSSVMLCGQRFTGKKSKWPSVYNQPPFNAIEVRTRDTFLGPTSVQV
jgi:hypothetical protein